MSHAKSGPNNFKVILFVVVLCTACATVLATLASVLKAPQEEAIKLDRNKQMLMCTQILNPEGYFQVRVNGIWTPAVLSQSGVLKSSKEKVLASPDQINLVYNKRIKPILVDHLGVSYDPSDKGVQIDLYMEENAKLGYAQLPLKLAFEILPNSTKASGKPVGFIIPVNGFGLWDAIYGYLALEADGNTVLGVSWYKHAETPGLGAGIAEAWWQKQFIGKQIFQKDKAGNLDPKTAQLGLVVLKGKVSDIYPNDPRATSAADGMSGATITGSGVTKAYKEVLESYRPFLIKKLRSRRAP